MKKDRSDSKPCGRVLLTGFDDQGQVVFEQNFSVFEYYEELHPIIDDNEFRMRHNIRSAIGKIYSDAGVLDQEFKTEYDATGAYTRSRATFADGTILED